MPPGDKSKNVRLELDNLSSRWALVGSTIEELVTKHELAIDGLKQYKVRENHRCCIELRNIIRYWAAEINQRNKQWNGSA